jgi:ferredoxin-thioredoxin reductase catalytic chain
MAKMGEAAVRNFIEKAAQKRGWKVLSDQEMLGDLVAGLAANTERYGYLQCPCRESWGEREKDRDIICPCDYAPADIDEYGHCYCALYQSEQFNSLGKEPSAIPERRPDDRFPD